MASLEHIDGKYYARISIWNSAIKKVKPRRVPLRTDVKGTALHRLKKVQKTETDIKSGVHFIRVPWGRIPPSPQIRLIKFPF